MSTMVTDFVQSSVQLDEQLTVQSGNQPEVQSTLSSSRLRGDRFLAQAVVVGLTATASVLLGWIPSIQFQSPSSVLSFDFSFGLNFETAAYAQSAVSDQEVMSYARSVLAIEPARQSAYNEIQSINGSVPPILCHRSLNGLPSSIRPIAVDYCNQAIGIVESNNLTITRFNEITVYRQSDADLDRRVRNALVQLQQ